MRNTLILFLLFISLSEVCGQQLPQAPIWPGTQFAWNPAMTANWNYLEANASYTQQWAGFEGAPQRLSLGFQFPFVDLNMSAGFQLLQDELGPLRNTQFQLSYAYHLPFAYRSRLSIGLQLKGGQLNYDPSREVVNDLDDPLLANGSGNASFWNVGLGIFYRNAELDEWQESHFFAGASLFQAIPQDVLLEDVSNTANFAQEWHAFALAGYRADIGGAFIEPSLQLDYAAENILMPRFNLLFEMHDSFWAGLSMDGSFSTSLQLGYIIQNGNYWNVRIGAFIGQDISPQGLNRGTSYGALGAYRYEL